MTEQVLVQACADKDLKQEAEPDVELTDDEKIDIVARRILTRYKPAFVELAK